MLNRSPLLRSVCLTFALNYSYNLRISDSVGTDRETKGGEVFALPRAVKCLVETPTSMATHSSRTMGSSMGRWRSTGMRSLGTNQEPALSQFSSRCIHLLLSTPLVQTLTFQGKPTSITLPLNGKWKKYNAPVTRTKTLCGAKEPLPFPVTALTAHQGEY